MAINNNPNHYFQYPYLVTVIDDSLHLFKPPELHNRLKYIIQAWHGWLLEMRFSRTATPVSCQGLSINYVEKHSEILDLSLFLNVLSRKNIKKFWRSVYFDYFSKIYRKLSISNITFIHISIFFNGNFPHEFIFFWH